MTKSKIAKLIGTKEGGGIGGQKNTFYSELRLAMWFLYILHFDPFLLNCYFLNKFLVIDQYIEDCNWKTNWGQDWKTKSRYYVLMKWFI